MDFEGFPKIPRLNRNIVITEKIDGTNAQVVITNDGEVLAACRNRWITTSDDNFGFAKWVELNRECLLQLGPGKHFGEWWGSNIQRNYGLVDRRFSLFNSQRWRENHPVCCEVVPVLYEGVFSQVAIDTALELLHKEGSMAAPGFMKAEGIVIWHEAARQMFKVLLENDSIPKGLAV